MSQTTYIYKEEHPNPESMDIYLRHQQNVYGWDFIEKMGEYSNDTIFEITGYSLKRAFEELNMKPEFTINNDDFYQIEVSY